MNVGAIEGGFGWRVSRTPHRTDLFLDVRVPPTKPMAEARRELGDLVRSLRERWPGVRHRVGGLRDGARARRSRRIIRSSAAVDASHAEVFGAPPERDVTRWFSDASVLTRYGIATVNYGTSAGLPDPVLGENLEIDGLVKMAQVYALAAARVCGVAG